MKLLKIRELVFDDVYIAAEILKSIEIDLTKVDMSSSDPKAVGVNVIKHIVGNSGTAKVEINNFLGSLFGITGEEFGKLKIKQSINCIKQIKELEGLSDFFDSVKDLTK
jgi:hypothetical protein